MSADGLSAERDRCCRQSHGNIRLSGLVVTAVSSHQVVQVTPGMAPLQLVTCLTGRFVFSGAEGGQGEWRGEGRVLAPLAFVPAIVERRSLSCTLSASVCVCARAPAPVLRKLELL